MYSTQKSKYWEQFFDVSSGNDFPCRLLIFFSKGVNYNVTHQVKNKARLIFLLFLLIDVIKIISTVL